MFESRLKIFSGNSLVVQCFGLRAFTEGAQVQSLVRELRFCKPHSMAKTREAFSDIKGQSASPQPHVSFLRKLLKDVIRLNEGQKRQAMKSRKQWLHPRRAKKGSPRMTPVLKTRQHVAEPHQSRKVRGGSESSAGTEVRMAVNFMRSRVEQLEDIVKAHYSFINRKEKRQLKTLGKVKSWQKMCSSSMKMKISSNFKQFLCVWEKIPSDLDAKTVLL